MDKIMKWALILAVLIISFSVAYHNLVFLPAKMELEREKLSFAEKKRQKNETSLEKCIQIVEEAYTQNWALTCQRVAEGNRQGYKQCINTLNALDSSVSNRQLNEDICKSKFKEADSGPNCALPSNQAETLNNSLDRQKKDCYQSYPLN